MSENQKIKIKNNLQINFHNHISKPNYLITINPDKFLQRANFNTAMTIKERDEINPEMAEIVRKILLKRKKEKGKKYLNNHSMRKDRKNNSLKKYFDDNYNKRYANNQENNNNNTIIFDSLNDRVGPDNKNIKYFDYINKSVNNKIKIIRKKKLDQNRGSHSVSRYDNKNLKDYKIPPNKILNYSYIQRPSKINDIDIDNEYKGFDTENNFYKKIDKSLNIEINNEDTNNKEMENFGLKLNSIALDEDKINKDENIMEIKCDYSYNEIISPKSLINKRDNKSEKKKLKIKQIKINYIDDKNIEKDPSSVKNIMNKKIIENNNDIKKKILSNNKKNFFGNAKINNKNNFNNFLNQSNQIKGTKYNKYIHNKSQEHRNNNELINTNNINNNINNQFNLTITNNFFKNNFNINNINNNIIKINNNKKTRLNHSTNKRDKILSSTKRQIKNSYKINPKNTYKNNSKSKSSPFHSKNSSNVSSELSHFNNNKKSRKIKVNNAIKFNEIKQKTNLNEKKNTNKLQKINNNKELLSDRRKMNSKLNTMDKNKNINLKNQKLLNDESNKSLFNQTKPNSQKSTKKEYPNMAKSKKSETKYIKKIESLCKKGFSGPGVKKTNQDNFFIYNNFNNNSNYVYLGVCDGHGLFGQDISTYLVNNLPQNMNKKFITKNIKNLSNADISLLSSTFQETFFETNISLNSDERIDSSYSGSTCVSVLFTPNRICCINVGDSRCILGKFIEKENKWIPKNLSRDHKPSEPDEMQRIKKAGGIVESYRDNLGNFVGPERVWGINLEGPGLAMSRSFGDEIGHSIGVVVDPEILEHFFEKEDKFIVLGSDGIWEFISNEEVVEIVKEYYLQNNIEGAIEHLYNEASKRWLMEEEVIDDITVIIIFLN